MPNCMDAKRRQNLTLQVLKVLYNGTYKKPCAIHRLHPTFVLNFRLEVESKELS